MRQMVNGSVLLIVLIDSNLPKKTHRQLNNSTNYFQGMKLQKDNHCLIGYL